MKKYRYTWIVICVMLLLSACTAGSSGKSAEESQAPTWQEQYDLGVRYLSEGNYQEAILAFTAAIEIDPKQAPAYVGRGDAYVLSGETEENLAAAKADYEKAIELDETNAEAYLGLADVYIRQGDYEKALAILQEELEKMGDNQVIADKITTIYKKLEIKPGVAMRFSQFGINNFITEEEFAIGGIPFYELSLESAIELLPPSDYPSEIKEIKDSSGNIRTRRYDTFKDGVNISCEQWASDDMIFSLSFYDSDNGTGISTGIRNIKIGDTMEMVLEKLGVSAEGAVALAKPNMSITFGANHLIQGGYGWVEIHEGGGSINDTPTKDISILTDTCHCEMMFVNNKLAIFPIMRNH